MQSSWSPPIKAFERGLAKSAEVLDVPAAYVEITPSRAG